MEPFKNFFNSAVIEKMAGHLAGHAADFDRKGFVAFACENIEKRELKERSNRILEGLDKYLPATYETAVGIIVASLDPETELAIDSNNLRLQARGIRGWAIMPLANYVALKGQDNLELSLDALRELTMRWTSEFAIRPFLKNHPEEVLSKLAEWALDENEHVRRLVSEGSRPRLPWGIRLHQFCEDPKPTIVLLEMLKNDQSQYVRQSVANHLNDIAKDHPDWVAKIARKWMVDASKERVRMVRHGLRTLIQQGHMGALDALGYGPAEIEVKHFGIKNPQVTLGNTLEFDLEIQSLADKQQHLIVDFIVHHQRANGQMNPKVFKWKNITLGADACVRMSKRHAMRPITTRKYYAGAHRLEILINGVVMGVQEFTLKLS